MHSQFPRSLHVPRLLQLFGHNGGAIPRKLAVSIKPSILAGARIGFSRCNLTANFCPTGITFAQFSPPKPAVHWQTPSKQ